MIGALSIVRNKVDKSLVKVVIVETDTHYFLVSIDRAFKDSTDYTGITIGLIDAWEEAGTIEPPTAKIEVKSE